MSKSIRQQVVDEVREAISESFHPEYGDLDSDMLDERLEEIATRADEGLDSYVEKIAQDRPPFDLGDRIFRYEAGDLDEDQMVELFQYLVNSGLALTLPGHYGRTAASLIEAGLIDPGHGQNVEAN